VSGEGAGSGGDPPREGEPQPAPVSPPIRDFAQSGSVPASHEGGSVPASQGNPDYTHAPRDRWAHRRGEPRTFAAAWIMFLFGATVVSVGAVGALGLLSADVYRPAARLMVALAAAGVCVLWPMVRLSQELPREGTRVRAVVQDLIVLLGPVQAVLWPQAFTWMAGWPWRVVLCLDLLIAGWAVLMGGLLATYMVRPRLSRWGMMAMLVLLVVLGPVIAALSAPTNPADPSRARPLVEWLMTSPLTGVYEITRDRSWTGQTAAIDARHWAGVVLAWAGGLLTWGAALIAGRGAVKGGRTPGEPG